ncbi:MAG: DUF58 domain-containing protein [Verrucomicrobiales bacterium]
MNDAPAAASRVTLRVRLAPRGIGLIVIATEAVLGGALLYDERLISLGLVGLLGVFAGWIAAAWNARGLSVSRRVPGRASAGAGFPVTVAVHNEKRWLAARRIDVRDALLPADDPGFSADPVPPGESRAASFRAVAMKRGVISAARFRVSSRFPLGLFEASGEGELRAGILVRPRPAPPPREAMRLIHDREPGELSGVREHRPGDPFKLVHWAATARSSRLIIRDLDSPTPAPLAILFHSCAAPGAILQQGPFETALQIAAGALERAAKLGIPITFAAGFAGWRPVRSADAALDALAAAIYAPEPRPEAFAAAALHCIPSGARALILSDRPLAEWRGIVPPLRCPAVLLDPAGAEVVRPRMRFGASVAAGAGQA